MKITLPVIVAALGFTSPSWAQSPSPTAATDDKAIRPFKFTASKEALADMRKRIAATRWPEKETVADHNRVANGGHFAAWEQPEILVTELRAAFKSLREAR